MARLLSKKKTAPGKDRALFLLRNEKMMHCVSSRDSMTREYWGRVGGLLIEEPTVVPRSSGQGRRFVDALIVPNRETARIELPMFDPSLLRGEEVIVVQTKRSRLGAYLAGQAIFSSRLVENWLPGTAGAFRRTRLSERPGDGAARRGARSRNRHARRVRVTGRKQVAGAQAPGALLEVGRRHPDRAVLASSGRGRLRLSRGGDHPARRREPEGGTQKRRSHSKANG